MGFTSRVVVITETDGMGQSGVVTLRLAILSVAPRYCRYVRGGG